MAEPIPATGYGPATWVDWADNWRKSDGDFLQSRSILRFAAVTDLATPQVGQVIYDNAVDILRLRSKAAKWLNVLAGENIAVTSSGGDVVLGHTSAGGGGLVFKYNAGVASLVASVPFGTANGEVLLEATGLTIDTFAGAGGTAKLTTNATHLLSSLPIDVSAVKTAALAVSGATTITTLAATSGTFSTNLGVTGTLGVTGATTVSTLTASGNIQGSRIICAASQDATINAATRKDYVDNLVSTTANGRVAVTGDTMTGSLTLTAPANHQLRLWSKTASDAANDPYLDFGNGASTFNQLGWIQCTSAGVMNIYCTGDITLNSGGGQVRTSDALYAHGGVRAFANGGAVAVIGTANNSYVQWFPNGSSVDSIGTRYGWLGYNSNGYLQMVNEVDNGSIWFKAEYGLIMAPSPSHTEVARFTSSGLAIGNSNYSISTEGHALWANGTHYVVTSTGGAANIYCNTINKVHGERWIWFERNAVAIGGISQNGTTGTIYSTTSDYRMKNIMGPITDAWERFKRLKVYRVTWKGDPERGETDDFLAHEVDEIVPDAVTGEKDAVNPDTQEPEMQMLGETRLVPLVTATLQEAMKRIEALEAQIAA